MLWQISYAQSNAEIDSIVKVYDYTVISNKLDKSQKVLEYYLQKAKANNYKKGIADVHDKLSSVYYLQSDFQKALNANHKALALYESLGDQHKQTKSLGGIAWSLFKLNSDESEKYFKRAIVLGEKINSQENLCWIYDNYGVTLHKRNLDSAKLFYQKSLNLKLKLKDSLGIPYSYFKLATVEIDRQNFTEAMNLLQKARGFFADSERFSLMEYHAYRGDVYFAWKKYELAVAEFRQSLEISEELETPYLKAYNLEQLAACYLAMNDYKNAFFYKNSEKQLRDSIFDIEKANSFLKLQTEFETERNLKEIAQQNEEIALREKRQAELDLEITRRNNILYFVFFVILILIVASWLIYRRIQRKRHEENLRADLEKAQLRNKFTEEKLRISRELHDNIGSQLTFMISSVDNLTYLENVPKDKLSRISNFGRDTLTELRSTVWAMNERSGTVEALCKRLYTLKNDLPVNLEILNNTDDREISGILLLNMFRIIQEFIQNTLKYAEATVVSIDFSLDGDQLVLDLNDDGKGFDVNDANLGNGLFNMKQRCEESNGNFIITSNENGTSVRCSFKN